VIAFFRSDPFALSPLPLPVPLTCFSKSLLLPCFPLKVRTNTDRLCSTGSLCRRFSGVIAPMRSSDFLPPVGLGSFSHRLRPTSRRLLVLFGVAHADADARSSELGHRRSAIAGFVIKEMAGSPELQLPLRHERKRFALSFGSFAFGEKHVTGPSSSYAPWSNTPPNALFPCPLAETPLLPSGGLSPSAFGIVCHFVAAFPWLIRSRTYASPMSLPTPSQGSLPTCRTWL